MLLGKASVYGVEAGAGIGFGWGGGGGGGRGGGSTTTLTSSTLLTHLSKGPLTVARTTRACLRFSSSFFK